MNWLKGFFENGAKQSMTDGIVFLIAVSGIVYAFAFVDYVGGVAMIGAAGILKGHKNQVNKK